MKNSSMKNSLSEAEIRQAVNSIKKGKIVSFPTETYYGVGVDPFNESAVEKLYALKGRDRNKPISLIVSNIKMLKLLTTSIPYQYSGLMKAYWPGPLTLIFPAKEDLNPLLTGNTGTIGVRISSHPTANMLCNQLQGPLTATSANISGKSPAKNVHEVFRYFGNKIDFICKGSPSKASSCSTIVSVIDEKLRLVRKGEIPFDAILNKAQ